nr:MAG TPA: hypothetical protein [Caudoviricetes sp.]
MLPPLIIIYKKRFELGGVLNVYYLYYYSNIRESNA